MEILQQPAALNFSGTLPDLIISDTEPVNFKLLRGAVVIIEEIYYPDTDDRILINLRDVVEDLLSVSFPDFGEVVFHQATAYGDFSLEINETDPIVFRVIKGGVAVDALDTAVFLAGNFLTWQPQQKQVQFHDPEWLTYYAQDAVIIKAKGYHAEGNETIEIATLTADQLTTLNLNYGLLIDLFEEQPLYIDVWTELDDERLSFIQRYILSQEEFQHNDVFVFENSLGGIDSIRFTGRLQNNNDFEFRSALFDLETRDYYTNPNPEFEKNTGAFRSSREMVWSNEFFKSLQKYYLHEGQLKRIIVKSKTLQGVKGQLNNYTFTFTWSKQNKYLNLSRADSLPEDLDIASGTQVTVIPPRLNEFPLAGLGNILFPVQPAFSAIWQRFSLYDLLKALGAALETEAGVTQFLSGAFKVYSTSDSYEQIGADAIITDLRLKGKNDYPVSSTQFGTEWRSESLVYDPILGKVKILDFELNAGEHITVSPGGVQEVPDSGFSYPELIERIELLEGKTTTLEAIAAPFILQGSGDAGGGMVLFKRPAADIPVGWVEVVDWRGRLPMGWNPDDEFFNVVGEVGGSKTHTNTLEEMVPHSHATQIPSAPGDHPGGDNGYDRPNGTMNASTSTVGGVGGVAQPYSILNPYRIVLFIEYKPA